MIWPRRPSSFIGRQGKELQGPDGVTGRAACSRRTRRVPAILNIGVIGADLQAPGLRVLENSIL